MRKIWFFVFLICTLSLTARADVQPKTARERFEERLAAIEKVIPTWATAEQVAEIMLSGGKTFRDGKEVQLGNPRIAAFNLQALAKLYSKDDEQFEEIRTLAKGIEDALGGYDKWKNVLKKKQGSASSETLALLQQNLDEARAALVQRLVDDHWVRKGTAKEDKKTRAQKLREFFASYKWPSHEKDRKNLLKRLAKQATQVAETEYDMGLLEHGDGVHELRRTLRWFTIAAQMVPGVVAYQPASKGCPVGELAPLLDQPVAKSKFSNLPDASEAPKDACLLTRCLFVGVAQWIQTLGDIKDEAEVLANATGKEASDSVPEGLREQANAVYKQIKRTEAIEKLVAELESCR